VISGKGYTEACPRTAKSSHTAVKQQPEKFLMSSTFGFSPDSFWLRVPAQEETIAVRPFFTCFGQTDELLCYVDDVLLGKLVTHWERPGKVISLLPTLDRNREYSWPTSEMFLKALLHVLRCELNAVLSCQRDTDQDEVLQLAEYDEVVATLRQVVQFSKDGGGTCPTFLYQGK